MTIDKIIIDRLRNAPSLECAGYQKLDKGRYKLIRMCLLTLGTIPEQTPCKGMAPQCEFKYPIQFRLFRKSLREK